MPGACVGWRTAGASKDKSFPGVPYRSRNRNPMIKARGDEGVEQSRPVKTPYHTPTSIMLGQLQPFGSHIPVNEIRSKPTGLLTCEDALRQFRMRQKLVRLTFAQARRRWRVRSRQRLSHLTEIIRYITEPNAPLRARLLSGSQIRLRRRRNDVHIAFEMFVKPGLLHHFGNASR